ncbi:F-box/kelch-repeat protein [Raphanus sativus]|nr:F-box/kelch-repeat protein [Raphanus sativus]
MSELMEKFSELSVSSPLIPDELMLNIVARVPRSHYPTLSIVSKGFRKLIASPKLYEERSRLGCKEHRVYAFLRPHMSPRGNYVPVGLKVYVFNDLDALSIDCTSHTRQPISDIPQRMAYKVVNVVDGKKIYVIGDSICHVVEEDGELSEKWKKAVTVFDTETQLWEPKLVNEDMSVGVLWSDLVMDGKIYLKSYTKSYSSVYVPEERKWELMDEVLNSKDWKDACVVDNVLYYHDCSETALRAHDPKQSCWSVVNGLEDFLVAQTAQSKWCDAVNYGEKKLALFFPKLYDGKNVICCAEIALERRQEGDIWGKVEWCDVVVEDGRIDIVKCVSVTIFDAAK